MSGSATTYMLHDETAGCWWYHLPSTATYSRWDDAVRSVRADGVEWTRGERVGWWAAPDQAGKVTVETVGRPPVVSYRLRDDYDLNGVSVDLPQTLTPDEYAERAGDYDDRTAVQRIYAEAYETVRGDAPIHVDTIDLSDCVRLDGAPRPKLPDGADWVADLPATLREHREYLHLFPGHLDGFRKAVTERINGLPGVKAYDHSDWTVFVQRDRTRELVKEGLVPRPPRRISGHDLAEAIAEWERLMSTYVDAVERAASGRVCPHCDGTGFAWDVGKDDDVYVKALTVRFRKEAGRSRAVKDRAERLARSAVDELRSLVARGSA